MSIVRTKASLPWVWIAPIGIVVACAAWWGMTHSDQLFGNTSASSSAATSAALPWNAGLSGGSKSEQSATEIRPLAQVRNVLFNKDGKLSDTRAPENWCVKAQKTLSPCRGLRDIFEYYIIGIGDISVQEIRALIEDESLRLNGKELTEQIVALFDKYWQVRTHDYKNQVVPEDLNTWMPMLEELRSVRAQILGEPWAKAFFDEDDREFEAQYKQRSSGAPVPPSESDPVPMMEPGKDPAALRAERVKRYGADAADRLEKVDQQLLQFKQGVESAYSEWSRIRQSTQLSEPQKEAELKRYIEANFDPAEHRRVLVLVKARERESASVQSR